MKKQNFLQKSDTLLLDYELSDMMDLQNNDSVGVYIKVGKTQEQLKQDLKRLTEEEIEFIIDNSFYQYDVLFTKENLQFLLSEIEKEENHIKKYGSPAYLQ